MEPGSAKSDSTGPAISRMEATHGPQQNSWPSSSPTWVTAMPAKAASSITWPARPGAYGGPLQRWGAGGSQRGHAGWPAPYLRPVRQRDVCPRRADAPLALYAPPPAGHAGRGAAPALAGGRRCLCPPEHRPRRAGDHALPAGCQPPEGDGPRGCAPRQLRDGHRRDHVRLAAIWQRRALCRRPGRPRARS